MTTPITEQRVMAWQFELVAGPFEGPTGGVVWDGAAVLFTAIDEGRLLRFDPKTRAVDEVRRYTNRVNGLARGPGGELYGAQEGGRRLVEFTPDGRLVAVDALLDGKYHNQPSDLVVDRAHRIWFADPHHPVIPFGPQIFPLLEHQSVLRLERNERRAWTAQRLTDDTVCPRAVLLSADEKTLYVADGVPRQDEPVRELRAYPVRDDGTLGGFAVLHTFGSDVAGPHRGVEGMCLDEGGNIVACAGWRHSGPGPMIYVFAPNGAVLETHPFPADCPNRCCFGGEGRDLLYVTSQGGHLYQGNTGRRGFAKAALR
jgi:gluconolactonase